MALWCHLRSRKRWTPWLYPRLETPWSMTLLPLYTLTYNWYRNICLQHWNTTQPSGQGTLHDFDKYFVLLEDTDKEMCLRFNHIPFTDALNLPLPFRKENEGGVDGGERAEAGGEEQGLLDQHHTHVIPQCAGHTLAKYRPQNSNMLSQSAISSSWLNLAPCYTWHPVNCKAAP